MRSAPSINGTLCRRQSTVRCGGERRVATCLCGVALFNATSMLSLSPTSLSGTRNKRSR
jgi:hypothetical protein